jgi:hypothetical protein
MYNNNNIYIWQYAHLFFNSIVNYCNSYFVGVFDCDKIDGSTNGLRSISKFFDKYYPNSLDEM